MTEGHETIVLVVDDQPLVSRSLSRMLKRYFDEILIASTATEADQLLERHSVTHLISDCYLGDGLPLGVDLVPGWRRRCPTITKAVVFSGTDLRGHEIPPEVDQVVQKGIDRDELLEALGVL
jgi:DNA-binding NarL/FixJ family response regulator